MQTITLSNGTTLHIREAVPDDAPDLLEYLHSISHESDYLSFGPGEFEMTEAQERKFLGSCQSHQNQVYLIGFVAGRIAGCIMFLGHTRSREQHWGEIGLSVRQDHWGQGIGTHLMRTLINWATENSVVTRLQLRVRTDNAAAIHIYRKLGFEIEGTLRQDFRVGEQYFDHHVMAKFVR